jgi:hypothetical protein
MKELNLKYFPIEVDKQTERPIRSGKEEGKKKGRMEQW